MLAVPVQAQTPPKTLVLYDAPPGTEYEKLGMSYAIMLRNLLGHFDAQVELMPVQQYTAGKINGYDATFYMGAYYNNLPPAAFLADAATTQKTLVWFKHNLWHLAWEPAYNFAQTRGFGFSGLRGMNAVPTAGNPAPGFFDTIQYKNKPFVKYYAYDSANNQINADPEIGVTAITDPAKASTLVTVSNPKTGEAAPYVVRSGKFWYVADLPFSYIGPRDRYLVLTDLLHDMLAVPHTESHKAMVRLEDV
ncbi:MAG: papd-like protein, partial [Burkholderiales bacterium]